MPRKKTKILSQDLNCSTKSIIEDAINVISSSKLFKSAESDISKKSRRKVSIVNDKNEIIFELDNAEAPHFWSDSALTIFANKYMYNPKSDDGEKSVYETVDRVVDAIAEAGKKFGGMKDGYKIPYFSDAEADLFSRSLRLILLGQFAAFNSPVWFNVGLENKIKSYQVPDKNHPSKDCSYAATDTGEIIAVSAKQRPQSSACFIVDVEDNLDSIYEYIYTSAKIFKFGSGVGADWSNLRSKNEKLSGGGKPSGPVSFMKLQDCTGGTIKSGGKTRRAAIMMTLNADHPDIIDFIVAKRDEEEKAAALVAAGFDGGMNGPAYSSIWFQNANLSVRCSDEFFDAVDRDKNWQLKSVLSGEVVGEVKARDLLMKMAECAWRCGDPGVQYKSTIDAWHTVPNTGPITSSNPCSEYMHVDNSACNLASINLLKFLDENNEFLVDEFVAVVKLMIVAQEILVGYSSYPTEKIARNSYNLRPLGLGYTNFGATLMAMGIPYSSDLGRKINAAITSLMSAVAYSQSALISSKLGPFGEFEKNKVEFEKVIKKHADHSLKINEKYKCSSIGWVDRVIDLANCTWSDNIKFAKTVGFRNSQVTVIAPTGTISLIMDCCTTGIEPELSLIKYKHLSGGGVIKYTNNVVSRALRSLGYDGESINKINEYIVSDKFAGMHNCDLLKKEHLPVFACSFPGSGDVLHWRDHLLMMAAAQPFVSGAISKTVNLPNNATVEDVFSVFVEGHKLGLKAVAIYRDGCKSAQPLVTSKKNQQGQSHTKRSANRIKLPDVRRSITHKFTVGGQEGYITIGFYQDGEPGEIFIVMSKEGSTVRGILDALGSVISISLQHGVPISTITDKLKHSKFEPSGITSNEDIRFASSVLDYISRWIELNLLPDKKKAVKSHKKEEEPNKHTGEICSVCGDVLHRVGNCLQCFVCGNNSGCG